MLERKFSYQDFGIGILTGLAVGAIAGILLAPESGESTRGRLVSRAETVKLTAHDFINGAKDNLDMAIAKLDGVFSSQEKHLRKQLGALKEELDKYNLSGA